MILGDCFQEKWDSDCKRYCYLHLPIGSASTIMLSENEGIRDNHKYISLN